MPSSSTRLVVLDGAGRVHSASPPFAAAIGRLDREMLGLPFDEVLPGVTLPEAGPAGEAEQTAELRFTNARGGGRDLRLSVSVFQGDPERRVVLVDDVTDRMRAERAVVERERLAS